MTHEEFDERIARFATRAEAEAAASGLMLRRKHNRPRAQFVGRYEAWTVYASPNTVLLTNGAMYDFQREVMWFAR